MTEGSPLQGQTAIVTGGAKGFGLAIAQRLAAEGCRVILWDRSFQGFDGQGTDFSPLLTQVVNVADLSDVQAAFTAAEGAAGRIDILVNNAGINGPIAPTWEYPVEAWDQVIGVDLNSVFYCTRTAAPHMRANGRGRIVNIASIAGKEGNAGGGAYAAAKGGVIAYTKSVAKELADSGVLVNCIAPAIAETDLMKEMTPEHIATVKAKIPMGRFLQPREVAGMVAWIAGPDCSFTTGFCFDLTGGRATY